MKKAVWTILSLLAAGIILTSCESTPTGADDGDGSKGLGQDQRYGAWGRSSGAGLD
tara:strand:- start:8654 stop:8821 length:168 start_codon:yes stop_codon:yes gene_type:complete